MEEDIKVLERVCEARKFDGIYTTNEIIFEAIENLIKKNKELEECLKAEEKYAEGLNRDIKSLLNIEPNDNFIPKSKVREKIDYYKKEWNRQEKEGLKNLCILTAGGISALEGLLEEGDK